MQALQYLARRADLQKVYQKLCQDRAALIAGADLLAVESKAAAEAMEFGKATRLNQSAAALRDQVADLTREIDNTLAELDEPEADVLIPFRPRVALLPEQFEAMDETAGLVAA